MIHSAERFCSHSLAEQSSQVLTNNTAKAAIEKNLKVKDFSEKKGDKFEISH